MFAAELELEAVDLAGLALSHDGYRGEIRLFWTLHPTKPASQMLAIQCDCGQWWGWTDDVYLAREAVDHLDANGCDICMG